MIHKFTFVSITIKIINKSRRWVKFIVMITKLKELSTEQLCELELSLYCHFNHLLFYLNTLNNIFYVILSYTFNDE